MQVARFIAGKVSSQPQGFTRQLVRIAQVAVGISLAVMLLSSTIFSGFQKTITDKVFGFWGHVQVTNASLQLTNELKPIELPQAFYPIPEKWKKPASYVEPMAFLGYEVPGYQVRKQTQGGVRHVQSVATIAGIIRSKNEIEGIILKGVGADFDWTQLQKFILEGRPIKPRTDSSAPRDILISQQTADRLKIKVGSKFSVHFVQAERQVELGFIVCGIYRTGLEEYDRKFALVDLAEVQNLQGWNLNQIGSFEIFLDDVADLSLWADAMRQSNVIPNDCYSEAVDQKYPAIFEWLKLHDINQWVILALMAVVALVNMTTALLILIMERVRMIGVLKSVGARNGLVRRIFLHYAARILGYGMLIGNALGLGLAFLQQKFGFIKLSEADYYLAEAPIHFNWAQLISINAITFVVILFFLILPTLMINKLSVIETLAFD
jgi:lipoprotein-releasing system permease protein